MAGSSALTGVGLTFGAIFTVVVVSSFRSFSIDSESTFIVYNGNIGSIFNIFNVIKIMFVLHTASNIVYLYDCSFVSNTHIFV